MGVVTANCAFFKVKFRKMQIHNKYTQKTKKENRYNYVSKWVQDDDDDGSRGYDISNCLNCLRFTNWIRHLLFSLCLASMHNFLHKSGLISDVSLFLYHILKICTYHSLCWSFTAAGQTHTGKAGWNYGQHKFHHKTCQRYTVKSNVDPCSGQILLEKGKHRMKWRTIESSVRRFMIAASNCTWPGTNESNQSPSPHQVCRLAGG